MESGSTTVPDLVEAAARRHPEAVAAVAGGQRLTYAELDTLANRLAHHLQASGVGPDVLVGVCLRRSLDLAVALLGVLKSGGACVPLDPAYPSERLELLASDAGVAAVITHSDLVGRLAASGGPVLRIDADDHAWRACPPVAPRRSTGPDHLAYVIYTSGSTGRPRGVMLTHRGLVNHHRAAIDLYDLSPGDRVLQFCSLGFDASIEEMFPTWAAGATVVFRPDDVPLLGSSWLRWLDDQAITVVNLPTAYWQAWTRDLDGLDQGVPERLRLVVVGGEKALGPVYQTWRRASRGRARWVNAYGPTETTCMSTSYEPPPGGDRIGDRADPPIGRPLPGTTVLVVDQALRPVPAGAAGELLIGGAGLARGYLHDPALTAERFVDVGTGDSAAARMYRTGDLVRQRPSGELDYVGRIDDQVKIQGFRIELGEIESALVRHPAVAGAVVVAREDRPGEKHLAAYVVPRGGATATARDLRRFLTRRLPGHMVPTVFTIAEALPLTPNGKVDRARLPAPARIASGHGRAAARSPAEDRVAAIWARVLGLDAAELGPDDDFFDVGGHSLLATQVMAQLREEFATDTPLRAIFETPTIGGLAAVVADAELAGGAPGGAPALVARTRQGGEALPLSLAQEQMWRLERAATPPGLYNITTLHRFDRPVDEDALRKAVAYLVDRHEILRTGFAGDAGRPYQFPVPGARAEMAVTPVPAERAGDSVGELHRRIAEQDATPFDPARPPLFRVGLYSVGDGATQLAVTFDHLVSDGTGAAIFMQELRAAYGAAAAGREPSLPPPPIQFADFAVWQRSHVDEEVLRRQLDWWVDALDGMPLGPALPFDRVPATPTRRIASQAVAVPAETRGALDDLARATGSTVFTVTAAAVTALLGRHGGSTDVVVSTTLSGRNRAEVEGLVGMFSGIGRIRVDLSGDPTFAAVVARARDFVLGMFENQDIPFMRVRRELLPDFPTEGLALAAALPVEYQYFHTPDDQEFFFRGQLHPLSVTLLDDGTALTGELSYKVDFYRAETIDRLTRDLERLLDVVAANPSLRLSELPITALPGR